MDSIRKTPEFRIVVAGIHFVRRSNAGKASALQRKLDGIASSIKWHYKVEADLHDLSRQVASAIQGTSVQKAHRYRREYENA